MSKMTDRSLTFVRNDEDNYLAIRESSADGRLITGGPRPSHLRPGTRTLGPGLKSNKSRQAARPRRKACVEFLTL